MKAVHPSATRHSKHSKLWWSHTLSKSFIHMLLLQHRKLALHHINAVKSVSVFSHNSHHYKPRENWIVFLASRFPRYARVPTHSKWGAPTSRLHFRALCAITSPTLNTECGTLTFAHNAPDWQTKQQNNLAYHITIDAGRLGLCRDRHNKWIGANKNAHAWL